MSFLHQRSAAWCKGWVHGWQGLRRLPTMYFHGPNESSYKQLMEAAEYNRGYDVGVSLRLGYDHNEE
jgi:hypothetical protein